MRPSSARSADRGRDHGARSRSRRPPMPGAPLEEPPPDRDLWPWLVVLVALVIAGIAAAWFATRDGNTRTVTQTVTTVAPLPQRAPKPAVVEATVPKVVGLQAPAALQALARAGLTGKTLRRVLGRAAERGDRPGSGRNHKDETGLGRDARGVEGEEDPPGAGRGRAGRGGGDRLGQGAGLRGEGRARAEHPTGRAGRRPGACRRDERAGRLERAAERLQRPEHAGRLGPGRTRRGREDGKARPSGSRIQGRRRPAGRHRPRARTGS